MFPPERTSLDLGDLLQELQAPSLECVLGGFPAEDPPTPTCASKFRFDEKTPRRSWDKSTEARCDFTPRTRLVHRAGFWFFALWQKSVMGRTLTDIKSDAAEVSHFATETATLIREVVGHHLDTGHWCIVTTPKRRHLTRNFATLIADEIARLLNIPFYEDVATCKSKHRVNAEFDLQLLPPEPNIIVFDDFVTTGSTLHAMKVLLEANRKNLMLFAGINNKL